VGKEKRATEAIALKVNRVSLGRLAPKAFRDLPVQPSRQKLKREKKETMARWDYKENLDPRETKAMKEESGSQEKRVLLENQDQLDFPV